ncbi:hypothetical protein NJ76_31090, partial [Rhodococcus sp. IITR03]
ATCTMRTRPASIRRRRTAGAVYQLTCSPVHNHVPAAVRLAFRAAWSRVAERVVRLLLGRVTAVPEVSFSWSKMTGPSFGNQIATLRTRGRAARLTIERSVETASGPHLFETVAEVPLTTEDRPPEVASARAEEQPSR